MVEFRWWELAIKFFSLCCMFENFHNQLLGARGINPEEGLWLDQLGSPPSPDLKWGVRHWLHSLGYLPTTKPSTVPSKAPPHNVCPRTMIKQGVGKLRICKETLSHPKKGVCPRHDRWSTSRGRQPPQFDLLTIFKTKGQMIGYHWVLAPWLYVSLPFTNQN